MFLWGGRPIRRQLWRIIVSCCTIIVFAAAAAFTAPNKDVYRDSVSRSICDHPRRLPPGFFSVAAAPVSSDSWRGRRTARGSVPSMHNNASHTHTHTHTHSLSLSLSLVPDITVICSSLATRGVRTWRTFLITVVARHRPCRPLRLFIIRRWRHGAGA